MKREVIVRMMMMMMMMMVMVMVMNVTLLIVTSTVMLKDGNSIIWEVFATCCE